MHVSWPWKTAHAATGPFTGWSQQALLANASFGTSPDPVLELQPIIDALRAQNVNVVEVDTVLSDWLTDAQFTAHMADIKQFSDMAHTAGLKVVAYYPCLEVLSPGGETGPSFYKNDQGGAWVQRDLAGLPNVFYGGLVFWVDPGTESVWLSPNSPWRDYYLARVRQLAATGIDGLWPDVPIYFNGLRQWCDASAWGKAAFRADSGLDIPAVADYADPAFRRFIEWRHRNLAQWQLDIAAAGRAVNPAFLTFVETVTMDYQDSSLIGLDGAYLRQAPGISQAWEVDILGNYDGMRHATADDWVCLISMYKYARAASGQKPAWAFSYGWLADDASQVMGEVLAAGCNPYEVKSPFKQAGVDASMRTRMYAFAQANQDRIFSAASLAKVAVYHSSASRDYVTPSPGNGMYANGTPPPDVTDWWSFGDPQQSCYNQQWLGEFRGSVKALLHAHVPFDVITSPGLAASDLLGYRAVVLPDLEAVSDVEAPILRQYVQGGGKVIVTGPNPTGMNQFGDNRTEYALADVLGFSKAVPPPASRQNTFGLGACSYFSSLLGGQYLKSGTQAAYDSLIGAVLRAAPAFVTLAGDPRIHLEARAFGADTLLHLTNYINFGAQPAATFQTVATTCSISVAVPAGKVVTGVWVASPDNASPAPQALPYSVGGGSVSLTLSIARYSLVIITMS
jgi:hypothetical protein